VSQFIVSLVGGAALGGIFALIGLGMVLVFRATATFNFAHGQFMILAAFIVAKAQTTSDRPLALMLPVSILVVAAVGALFYKLVLERTAGMPHFMGVIASLGVAAILDGVMSLTFGPATYSVHLPFLPTGVVSIFGARVSSVSLVIAAFSIGLAVACALVMQYTQIGTMVRAAGQDALLASQAGIRVRWVFLGSWVLASALAAIAGLAYGATNVFDLASPAVVLAVFPAVLLGGLDSIPGAIVGGIGIGVFQGFVASYAGGQYIDVATYSVLLVVLLFRPTGLFGTSAVTRV
jgi:branched-chain amino acid transport system permease protein